MAERAFRREIRQWARANGFPQQKDTGWLLPGVREAWNATHPDRPAPEAKGAEYYRTGYRSMATEGAE
jgi:hypothetical protein